MEQVHFLLWMSFTHFSEIAYWDHKPQNIQTYRIKNNFDNIK